MTDAHAEANGAQARAEPSKSADIDINAVWERVAYRLRVEMGEDLYSSWFARLEPVHFSNHTLVLSVPTRFLKNWIESHYLDRVIRNCRIEYAEIREIEVKVRSLGKPLRGQPAVPPHAVEQDNNPGADSHRPEGATAPLATRAGSEWLAGGTTPDRSMTFDTFLTGKSNALAHAAAMRVAQAPSGMPLSFNPLYLHSPTGYGKTHLLNAIAGALKSNSPGRKVFMLSAERFMYFFVAALQNRNMLAFKDFFRAVDVLLIDDFQFLQGRSMQQEFCHTFNSLVDSQRQVIVAADLPPAQLDSIDSRMRSRLAGGLVVDIEPAEYELRANILRARTQAAIRTDPSLALSEEVIEFIARRITGGGRELDGALKRVWAHQQLLKSPITVELAELAIKDLIHAAKPRRISIDDILREIGRHFSVAKADLLSPRRARSIVRPRQIGMYLAKQLTTRSLPEIGRRFGGRDHSTVLHAIRKVNELMANDEDLVKEVSELTRKLQK